MPAIAPTDEAIEAWLAQAANLERAFDLRDYKLDRIVAFLAHLPRPPAPCTVTGTKGKGSTVRFIEAGLNAAGMPTVAFTSPHIATVRERWRIDGVLADAATIAERCTRVAAIEERTGIRLTYFERCFAIAVLLAAERPDCRFLLEVGLGGRLDCANALDARLVVLTHLSRDHCAILGDTLEQIAAEKLALCRPGVTLIVAPQSVAARRAILAGRGSHGKGALITWVRRERALPFLAMPGQHQQDNAATALAAIAEIEPALDPALALKAMAEARLAARCQLVTAGERRVLVDGAHNGPSVAATVKVAHARLRHPWRLLIGVANDKEIDEILDAIPYDLACARVGYRSPRARGRDAWPQRALAWPWFDDIGAALAAQPAGADVCVTGSFYLAGEALGALGAAGQLPG
ncbi:MAG TPA: hypothetical protein VEL07_19480 [Planctomycetota bacterium]|nr:hypothetical protein [Planctomycetota bacterium]